MLPDRQLKVLLVEDNETDREIYKQCLRTAAIPEIEFAEAASAAAGIDLAQNLRPDCILLDYELPDYDGLEVMARLKALGQSGAVVMLTAFGGEELAVRAMKAGVTDYLPKRQVSVETLAHTVANAVQKVEMEARIEQYQTVLERSERRYETLLEAMPQMVWVADVQGAIQYANHRWLEYTGLTVENAGHPAWERVLHPEDRERTRDAWQSAVQMGSVFEIEHRLRRAADQSYRWHLVRAIPAKNRRGEVTNWFGTCTEVEQQKQAERAAMEREKLEGLGVLAGGIAHDFNNLLVSILCGASLAKDALPPMHSSRPVLDEVIRAGERAAELTQKMLTYSGRSNLFVERVDLGQLVRDTCQTLRASLPLEISLEVSGDGDLPPVQTDARRLRELVQELVRNAAEAIGHTRTGSIGVRCGLAEDRRPTAAAKLAAPSAGAAQFLFLEVQDTGCGMNPQIQAKMFDPFFSTKFAGRGMGLSAVQGFVRSNGGAIQVSSSMGEGTTVRVLLPAASDNWQSTAGAEY